MAFDPNRALSGDGDESRRLRDDDELIITDCQPPHPHPLAVCSSSAMYTVLLALSVSPSQRVCVYVCSTD